MSAVHTGVNDCDRDVPAVRAVPRRVSANLRNVPLTSQIGIVGDQRGIQEAIYFSELDMRMTRQLFNHRPFFACGQIDDAQVAFSDAPRLAAAVVVEDLTQGRVGQAGARHDQNAAGRKCRLARVDSGSLRRGATAGQSGCQ